MTERVLSGRYALREVVGTGGMSIVYKAWDSQQRREVALKVLRPELSDDEEFVRRFTNEAHAVLQMHHANIVDIYGLGQDGQTRYIVMEFVNGVTLKELIRQGGPIKPRRAVQMAIRILAAVDHAHKNHIVHRDIKPQNILVNADYHVKVTDFGIARATNADKTAPDRKEAEKPEERRNVLGSVHYFSPEQASGQVADEKSDLYSAGVVLYEMLTGKVPFDGDTPEDVAIKHVRETPVLPGAIQPGISKALDQVIERALAKDSARRYQTAAEMAADLKRALRMPEGGFVQGTEAQTDAAKEAPKKPGWRNAVQAAAAVGAIALAIALFFLGRGLMRSYLSSVETPAVVHMHIEEAVALLDEAGVHYIIEETPEGDTPVGTVIGQYPEPGERLAKDSRLTVYVSTGAHSTYVPTLVGMDVVDAMHRIEEYGLALGKVEYMISEKEPGTVLTQNPPSQEYVADGSEISLVVSGESVTMPDCIGMTLEEARIVLELEGFAIGEIVEQTDVLAPDTVIVQSIKPQTQLLNGGTVDLVICRLAEESAWCCNAEIRFEVPTALSEVRMTLEDGDGLRTVYREELALGEHVAGLTLLSRTQGKHLLSVYIGGELVLERYLEFR